MQGAEEETVTGGESGSAPAGTGFVLCPDAVAAVAREKLAVFARLYPRVLPGDDAEAIHDFRVASRRLQQALDFLHPPGGDNAAGKLRRTIRRARRAVSILRNQDVTLELLRRMQKRTRSRPRQEVLAATVVALTAARAKTLDRARRELVRLRLDQFYLEAGVVLAAGAGTGDLARRAAAQLGERWRVFAEGVEALSAAPDPRHLHQTRIDGKKLRYLAELLDGCGLPGAGAIAGRVRKAQTAFGDWLDEGMLKAELVVMIPGQLERGRILLTLIQQSDRRAQKLLAECLARLNAPEMAKIGELAGAVAGRLA